MMRVLVTLLLSTLACAALGCAPPARTPPVDADGPRADDSGERDGNVDGDQVNGVDEDGVARVDLEPCATACANVGALAAQRDRLLDALGARDGGGRCEAWAALNESQRAQLLVLTDLLGKRTHLADGTNALSHVVTLHAVRGQRTEGCVRCCGDGEFNRAYFSVDDALAHALRNGGLAAWGDSQDLAGPHDPFTRSLETHAGQPTGQAHFFDANADVTALGRLDVEDVVDPHALELDIDFNLIHESSPLCEYGTETGLERYERVWRDEGAGGDAELGYTPTGC